MRFGTYGIRFLACLCALLCLAASASADVAPGDTVDKTNWEKVQGMVPEPVLNYVKKGDLTIHVVNLEYDPADYMSIYAKESLEPNRGKYDLNDDGIVVDVQSRKLPDFIGGIPFPEIDLNDPKAGAKIVTNHFYQTFSQGNVKIRDQFRWIGRGGLERVVESNFWQYPMDGYPPRKAAKNKNKVERYSIIQILAPYDIAGTNILLWRYRDARPDSTFGYIPAIRRVRRMSPSNRSDAFIGSDLCVDDAWTFDGKVSSFTWKLVGKKEGLIPYVFKKAQPIVKISDEAVQTTRQTHRLQMNYDVKDAQNAPWFPSEKNPLAWVKRPVYVVELTAKDPYYNYGKMFLWLDAGNPTAAVFKTIYDRAGKYWKNVWMAWTALATEDKSVKLLVPAYMLAADDRTDHATMLQGLCEDFIYTYFDDSQTERDYSLAGFQRLSK